MQEFKNNFSGGRNSDADPSVIPPNQYISANFVELVGEGNFYALRNIKGTTLVKNLSVLARFNVMAVFENKYLIGGESLDCLTIISAGDTQAGAAFPFKIQCYDIANDTLYELYEEDIPESGYNTEDRVVQAVNNPENGVDHIYFTDFYHEMRHFKCEIPDPYSANFLTKYDLSLQRRGANGTITATIGTSGGTLLSGTYQFCYRMSDPTNKLFTKWSSLTNPIHVYDKTNSTDPVYSGIGLVTDRKISLTITPSSEETTNYDYLQLAVLEHIGPSDAISASLLEIESIPSTSLVYDYKSNSKIGTIPLEQIVVDLAQVEKVKTLAVKDNRLFAGNVHYTELEFDNGNPTVTSGTIITQADTTVDSFSKDEFASNYKGYWRGEVYRFGVVYTDEYGNKSPVYPLDLSGITDNDITPGLTDLKFPDRTGPDYTLFNSSNRIQSLGVRLTGLNNHPSWARSLEIVRVNRTGNLKNILFQSPIIPMVSVNGIGALDDYPNFVSYDSGTSEREEENATPMTSGSVMIPKNLLWPDQRAITINRTSSTANINSRIIGEAKLEYVGGTKGYEYSMVFPSDSMYDENKPFVYTGSEKIDFIDYALLKSDIDAEDPNKTGVTHVDGDDVNTKVTATLYSLANNQYYFSAGHGKSAIANTDIKITGYEMFNNLGQPTSVAGKSVMDYDALQTGGIELGFKPTICKSAVVKLGGTIIPDAASESKAFSAATWNNRSGGGALSSASATLVYESDSSLSNKYINQYLPGYSNNNSYVNVVAIANVKLGLGDDRYGESTDIHEYISTGTRYTFSSAEVATLEGGGDVVLGNLDVWGGDCFVGSHVFKVCDSTYSVVNQTKNNGAAQSKSTLLLKWNKTLFNGFTGTSDVSILCMPVAVEAAAQYVQVILESDYSEVREQDILTGSSASIPVMTGTVDTARSPLTYKYNHNLNKQNSQKIYVTKPQFSFEQNEFNSRVIYSDLKIYNSSEAGFDIFRVANFYDLEEKYRPITKLAVAGNQLYSIHEQGIIYLPTGENQVEQADGGTLAVRSGDVIGKPIVIDSERGSRHPRGIVETGGVIYIPDNRNKNVYVLSGQQLRPITQDNETTFRTMFDREIGEGYVLGVYHPVRREYWVADIDPFSPNTQCEVYSEQLNGGRGGWVCNYYALGRSLRGSAYTNQNLYIVGLSGGIDDTSIYSFYTGTPGDLYTSAGVLNNVTFAVNPDPSFTKTFDCLMFSASERLSGASFVVSRESSLGDQTATKNLAIESYKGNWRVSNPRDAVTARLRGMYAKVTMTWSSTQSALREVWSKIRYTARRPF